jgi:hypothetical protein
MLLLLIATTFSSKKRHSMNEADHSMALFRTENTPFQTGCSVPFPQEVHVESRLYKTWLCMAWQSRVGHRAEFTGSSVRALFRLPQKLEFFHSLFITSIFGRMHEVVNVDKKITNCTV